MQNYFVIGLMNILLSKLGDNLIHNSIYILFWTKMYMVSNREDIIPNTQFQSSGPLLLILSVSGNVHFVNTREVS